jgi:hypothetical protein
MESAILTKMQKFKMNATATATAQDTFPLHPPDE